MHRSAHRVGCRARGAGRRAAGGTGRRLRRGAATPWGDPDLQGVWEYWTFTPLEKPAELAGREVLTEEEAAVIAQRLSAEAVGRDDTRPPEGETGGYNQSFWTERSRAEALTQPSLLVDPPDGGSRRGRRRSSAGRRAHRDAGERPVRLRATGVGSDGPEDRGLAERCIVGFSTGPADAARRLQQQHPGLPG